MDITISKEELSKALGITQGIVDRKTTMPILVNILISASEGSVSFASSDLEITAVTRPEASIHRPGKTTVNARVFNDIVRELPDGEIRLTLSDGERLEIVSGPSRLKINGQNADEYPGLPGMGLIATESVKASHLLDMINKTLYAVSNDETRFNLNGVCFTTAEENGEKCLRLVATDGHRLALVTRPLGNFTVSEDFIVPRKGLQEVKKILADDPGGEVGLAVQESFLVLDAGRTRVSMRLIDGQFPDYTQVMPKDEGEVAVLPRELTSQALKRVALMVTDKGKCVKMDFSKGKLRISSQSPELGEAQEELDIQYDGEPLSIGFNANYVMDIAGSLENGETMCLDLHGALGPGRFYGEGDESYFGIVMPMRLT